MTRAMAAMSAPQISMASVGKSTMRRAPCSPASLARRASHSGRGVKSPITICCWVNSSTGSGRLPRSKSISPQATRVKFKW